MKHHPSIQRTAVLYSISIVSFFSALHMSLPAYFNSSFLSTFADENTVSLIYLIISIVTIVGFLSMNTILRYMGNLRASLLFVLAQIAIFYGIITLDNPKFIILLVILGLSTSHLIIFTIDIFLQKITDFSHTGGIRGMYLTAGNFAWILAPLLGGMFVVESEYKNVYIAAFLILFPLLYLVYKSFHNFRDAHYINTSVRQTFIRVLKNRDMSRIFIINTILQTFYAWMTVYTPIYLHSTLGFAWNEIGIIFTLMLLPFILVELPLGKLADKKYGEKEIMAIGFTIMGVATASLAFFTKDILWVWAALLFITRLGAASSEIMIETYFFKKTSGRDPEMLGMFRVTRPLSYFVAPVIATIGLVYTTDQYLFVILGLLCLFMLYPILTLRDTN